MDPYKIFIVEDEAIFSRIIAHHLSLNPDYEVDVFANGKQFLSNLYRNPSVVTLDYNLPGMTGLEILTKIKEFNPELPVIIVSGQQEISTAVELLKKGAYDYVLKDQDTKDRLWNIIKNLRETDKLKQKVSVLEQEVVKKYEFGNIIKGNSTAIERVFQLIEKAARTGITVSITGETGTGKELVAKSIHFHSARSHHPFVAVNVSAIPKELMEAEMFGHEKGAFTGAMNRRIGKFEEAQKGTIFLDEIGDMDLNMQSKLLRVLQEEEVTRIGGNAVVKLDVRVICATHKNLIEEVKKGNFREDLYYRLLGLPIEIPPLRDRKSDVFLLARHFVEEFCAKNKMKKLSISPEAFEKLGKYPFPGNVRELKAIIELAAVMADSDTISAMDIKFSSTGVLNDFLQQETTLEEYNRRIIKHFLEKYENKVRLVADKLGVGKTTIYRMMQEEKL